MMKEKGGRYEWWCVHIYVAWKGAKQSDRQGFYMGAETGWSYLIKITKQQQIESGRYRDGSV